MVREFLKQQLTVLKHLGIPPLFHVSTFDNFEYDGEYVAQCSKWLDNPTSILFTGVPGTGKTHLAISVLKELFNRGHKNGRFISVPMLMREIKDTFRQDTPDTEMEIIRRYISYDVLVLDDVGAEYATDYAHETIYVIVDGRICNNKPTIYTTNLTLRQIERQLDPRIASRMNGGEIIKIDLPDFRSGG